MNCYHSIYMSVSVSEIWAVSIPSAFGLSLSFTCHCLCCACLWSVYVPFLSFNSLELVMLKQGLSLERSSIDYISWNYPILLRSKNEVRGGDGHQFLFWECFPVIMSSELSHIPDNAYSVNILFITNVFLNLGNQIFQNLGLKNGWRDRTLADGDRWWGCSKYKQVGNFDYIIFSW